MTPCGSCGGRSAPPQKPLHVVNHWAVRWPHGPVQAFDSEQAARAYIEANPDRGLTLLAPAS